MTSPSGGMTVLLRVGVHVLLRSGDWLLLGRRVNTGYEDGKFGLPSGMLDAGENLQQAACRETREEVGVTVSPDDLRLVHIRHNPADNWLGAFFDAGRWTGEPYNAEPDKCSELLWAPQDELPRDIAGYVHAALRHIRAGRPYSTEGDSP